MLIQADTPASAPPQDPEGPRPGEIVGTHRSLAILLVEDDELVRAFTADLIAELGHAVLLAASAEEAVGVLKSRSFDVLITDINLPGMSGEVLAAEARAVHPSIGIVFVTGRADIRTPVMPGFGPVVLHKPFEVSTLESVLRNLSAA
jgi:DNA-binding response OmpR family regulator